MNKKIKKRSPIINASSRCKEKKKYTKISSKMHKRKEKLYKQKWNSNK